VEQKIASGGTSAFKRFLENQQPLHCSERSSKELFIQLIYNFSEYLNEAFTVHFA
jgi:hypothetical protein